MIVDKGLERETSLIKDDISTGAVGDDNTSPSASDTALGNQLASTSVTDSVSSGATFTTKFLIDSGTANGDTLKEAGLFSSSGDIYSRDTHPDISKTSTDEVTYFYKIVRERA